MPRKAPSSYPVSKDSVSKSPVTSAARKKPGSRPLSDSSTSSSTSGGTPASSVASSGPQSMEYASPPKDRPLRGVTNSGAGHSPDHDRPAPSSVGRSASGGKAKSVPSRNRSRSADDVSGGVEMSSRQQRLAAADTGEVDPSLQLAAKERFGDKVGPVVCAHLHLQGVDVEDDLRYVDAVSLVETAETSGLKKVQIIKLSDWVTQAQQVPPPGQPPSYRAAPLASQESISTVCPHCPPNEPFNGVPSLTPLQLFSSGPPSALIVHAGDPSLARKPGLPTAVVAGWLPP